MQKEKFLKMRKALLVMPLIALPFVTLAFWSLGGGKGTAGQMAAHNALNKSLPAAQLNSGLEDKMSIYHQAALDSQNKGAGPASDFFHKSNADSVTAVQANTPGGIALPNDNEMKLRTKLASLQQSLSQPAPPSYGNVSNNVPTNAPADLARLQQMLSAIQQPSQPDPEMSQISGMLEKILDIQHPERVTNQLKEASAKNRGRVYPVTGNEETQTPVTILQSKPIILSADKGFYDVSEPLNTDSINQQAVPATVEGSQTVTTGATLKMKLTQDVLIGGVLIPSSSFIYGKCSVEGERLKVQVTGLRSGTSLFPVSLNLYDQDAMEGIRIPGAITRDASKEGADRAIQSMQLMTYDPSFGAQAAGAGVEAAKGLLSKKVKLVRVTVKAGYPVLLLDDKAKQQAQF